MVRISIETNSEQVAANIRKRIGAIPRAVRQGLQYATEYGYNWLTENLLTGGSVNVRTGTLRRSWSWRMKAEDDAIYTDLSVDDGPARPYAKTLNDGGTITPKRGKYLAVPTLSALTPRGVLKGEFQVPTLRAIPGLFVFKSKSGNLYIGKRRTTKAQTAAGRRRALAKPIALFRLMQSVTIQARRFREATIDEIKSVLKPMIAGRIRELFKGK